MHGLKLIQLVIVCSFFGYMVGVWVVIRLELHLLGLVCLLVHSTACKSMGEILVERVVMEVWVGIVDAYIVHVE